jgi:hypothetical protein
MPAEVGWALWPTDNYIRKKYWKKETFADCSLEKQKWLQGNAGLQVIVKSPQNWSSTNQPHRLVIGPHIDQKMPLCNMFCNDFTANYFADGSVSGLPYSRKSNEDFDIWGSRSSAATTSFMETLRATFVSGDLLTPPKKIVKNLWLRKQTSACMVDITQFDLT